MRKSRKNYYRRARKENGNMVFIIGVILAVAATVFIAAGLLKDTTDTYMESHFPKNYLDDDITVCVYTENGDVDMPLGEYLIGVVSSEMPASYDVEALKAQAMAARTYTAYKMKYIPCDKSENAVVCTDPSHCQAYADNETLKERWGNNYDEYINKVESAVRETDGKVITYDGKLIEALYTASCGGVTEDSENVFGNALPYLKSVESADKDEQSKVYTFTLQEYVNILRQSYDGIQITVDNAKQKTQKPQRYESGRVKSIKIANADITGGTMRKLFSLPSTMFTITFSGNSVIFDCKGYGHGVGLSQVGANGFAEEGMNAEEIVKHYYTGVSIENIEKILEK